MIILKSLKFIFNNIEEILASFLLLLLVTLMFLQVLARYLIGHSITWSEELLRFTFLAMVYIASAMGAKYGKHFRVTALVMILPNAVQKIFNYLQYIIWIGFNLFVIYYGFKFVFDMTSRPQISPALDLDMRYVYVIMPIAFIFQTIRLLQRLLWEIKYPEKLNELNIGGVD